MTENSGAELTVVTYALRTEVLALLTPMILTDDVQPVLCGSTFEVQPRMGRIPAVAVPEQSASRLRVP
jgi:hypothetical protein